MRCRECRQLKPHGLWARMAWGWLAYYRHQYEAHGRF